MALDLRLIDAAIQRTTKAAGNDRTTRHDALSAQALTAIDAVLAAHERPAAPDPILVLPDDEVSAPFAAGWSDPPGLAGPTTTAGPAAIETLETIDSLERLRDRLRCDGDRG